ncbi:MAG: PAS domain S-box protein [Velocimicrobium sp.]
MDKSRNKYQIFDNMLDIILVVAKDGTILYGNKKAVDVYGYTLEELLDLSIFCIRKNDEKTYVQQQLDHASENGIEFETYHYKKDGTNFPVNVRSIVTQGEDKDTVISIIRDVTSIRRLEDKEKMFDASLDIAEEAIIVTDRNFHITLWNKAAEKRLGYREDELVGCLFDRLVPNEKMEELCWVKNSLRAGKVIEHNETVRCHKGGYLVEVSVSCTPCYDKDGMIIAYIGIYSDISKKRKEEKRLKENQERAALALEGANYCIWDMNLCKKRMNICNSMESLLGYENDEVGTRISKWFILIHPVDRKELCQLFTQHIKDGKELITEFRIQNKENEYVWLRAKGKVVDWEDSKEPCRMIGINEDISQRKKMEFQLLEKNKELEQMSHEAQKANEAKTLFLANMSHEIRTPLNGIISVIQLMQKTKLSMEQEKLIKLLKNSAVTLKGIVSDILDISKAEQQKIEVCKTSFSLKDMVQTLFNELQIEANRKGIEVGYYFDPDIQDDMIGDGQKVRQILNNLVSNAIKFTDEGYISLKARLCNAQNNQALIEFSIKDTGIGISKAFGEHLFEKFVQGDLSYEKKYSGTGLGLAISKQFAKAMGGDITFHSIEGKGSTFYLRCAFELPQKQKKEKKKEIQDVNKNSMEEQVILCVDDNLVNQNVIEYILEQMGHKYLAAYNSKEALFLIEQYRVNLVLMDIQLPEVNGYQLTKMIRAQKKMKGVPIIAMTAYSQIEDREKCLASGMDEFIVKPIDVDNFIGMINSALLRKN